MGSFDVKNYRQKKAIEAEYGKKFEKICPNLNDDSGIYFFTRTDENGISYFYIGQSLHLRSRIFSHSTGWQHIDKSIRKRGVYSEDNPYGWRLGIKNYPGYELDKWEQHWILEYTKAGYQCRYNKTAGGQGEGKEQINEYKPPRGYQDGLYQGRKNLAKELKHIIETHLVVMLKPEKQNNKVSQKALEKFNELLEVDDGTE